MGHATGNGVPPAPYPGPRFWRRLRGAIGLSGRPRFRLAAILTASLAWSATSAAADDHVYGVGELPAAFTRAKPGLQTIVFVGDIMPWDRAAARIQQDGPEYPFSATKPLVDLADLVVGDLEGPVAETLETVPGDYRYRIPPFTLGGLKGAGIDLVSLANNHLMDCGQAGLAETLAHLQEAGLRSFGAGRDAEEASRPAVVTVGGTRVAFVAAVCPETQLADWEDAQDAGEYERWMLAMRRDMEAGPSAGGTVLATPDTVREMVRRASAAADLVVAYLHFGIRYHRSPTLRQRALAHAAVEGGAGLVVGHHAHFWQPVECYRGAPIFYGIGNYAFGSANRRADEGLLLRAVLERGRLSYVEIFPLCTRNRDPDVNYQSKVLAGIGAAQVIKQLGEASRDLGASVVLESGCGRLTVATPGPEPTGPGEQHP